LRFLIIFLITDELVFICTTKLQQSCVPKIKGTQYNCNSYVLCNLLVYG